MSGENSNFLGAFNIKKLITLCFKNWKIFLLTVFCCTFFTGAISVVFPQKVEVLSQLMLKDDTGSSSMMMAGQIARSFSLGDMFGGSSTTDNETFVIKSHTVFLQTARQLELNTACYTKRLGIFWQQQTTDPAIRLTVPAEMSDTISQLLIFKLVRLENGNFDVNVKVKRQKLADIKDQPLPLTIKTSYGDFVLSKTDAFDKCLSKKFKITYCSYDAAAESYARAVKVYVPDRRSDFIDISFATHDPEFGKLLINTIISNYNDISNVYKFDRSKQSLKLVDDRLTSLENELTVSESNLENFKKQNKLTDVEVDAQYLMAKTGTLESSLLEAQTNYEVIKLTKEYISNPENNYSLIPELYVTASASSDVNGASQINQYNQLILQRMDLLSSAKGNSAIVKQLDQQIDALRANIITSVNRAYQNSSLVLRDLKNEDLKNKSRIGELPSLERQYIELKRDNLLQEQMYLFLLQQREELNMSLSSRSLPAQVIDPPYVLADKPGLSRKMMLALGVLLGLIAGLLYVVFKKMLKAPLSSGSEIDSSLKVPTLQSVALDKSADKGFNIGATQPNGEAFRRLRSDVQFELDACQGKVAVVTSSKDGEGKSYVAINLAGALAATGKRVVLVDASLRDPKVAADLGVNETSPIFSEYVYHKSNSVPVAEVPVNEYTSLSVVATKATNENPSDLIASDRFAEIISTLRNDFDYVIIDSSCINDYCDIYYLTNLADITLIVCRQGVVCPDDIANLNKLYADGRLKRMAVVKNAF